MKKKHYLSREEGELIDSKYRKDCLYKHLKSLALKLQDMPEYFVLSPADLFYQVLDVYDTILDMCIDEEEDEEQYCKNILLELANHFSERVECNPGDHKLAALLTVCAVENLLTISNRQRYYRLSGILMESAKGKTPDERKKIEDTIREVMYDDIAFLELQQWLRAYEASNKSYSSDIYDMIMDNREQHQRNDIENKEEIIDNLKQFFWNNADKAEEFLYDIYGKNNRAVIEEIEKRVTASPLRMQKGNKKKLHTILHKEGLYTASHVSFSNN